MNRPRAAENGQRPVVTFAAHFAVVFRVHDGKITGIDTYFSNIDMVNAFFV